MPLSFSVSTEKEVLRRPCFNPTVLFVIILLNIVGISSIKIDFVCGS